MRIIIAALTALIVSAYDTIQDFDGVAFNIEEIIRHPHTLQDLLFLFFSLYFLAEGVVRLSKSESPAAAENPEMKKLEQEHNSLKTAYEEIQERLKNANAVAQSKLRPQAITAELVNFLSLLQSKGRLIDFLSEDITPYPNAQIGAAARVVHQGCSTVLRECFKISPICSTAEGQQVTVDKDYNSRQYRLIGKIGENPPHTGKLLHRGWQTAEVNRPRVMRQEETTPASWIIVPAEIEVEEDSK